MTNCKTIQKDVCNEHFKSIETSLKYIKENIDEHRSRSDARQEKFNKMATDIEVLKQSEVERKEKRIDERWKTGIMITIISVVVSSGTAVALKLLT